MKRRDFLKLIGIAPFAPSVLKAAPKAKPISTKTNEFGWSQYPRFVSIDPPLNDYIYVSFIYSRF